MRAGRRDEEGKKGGEKGKRRKKKLGERKKGERKMKKLYGVFRF